MVCVRHHTVPPSEFDDERGTHRWAVYAYLYPGHRLFPSMHEGMGNWDDAFDEWPLHGGCSRILVYRVDGIEISSFEIGSDYDHSYDHHCTHWGTPAEASEVFRDADRLFTFLSPETGGAT